MSTPGAADLRLGRATRVDVRAPAPSSASWRPNDNDVIIGAHDSRPDQGSEHMTAGRLIVVLVIAGVASACDFLGPSRREFLIHVDSAVAPTTASPNASLQLLVFGPVGPNLCYSFKEFRITRGSGSADVSVV